MTINPEPTLKQRKEWHPPCKDAVAASCRLKTLINRLRYRGNYYDADIAEFELKPFIQSLRPTTKPKE